MQNRSTLFYVAYRRSGRQEASEPFHERTFLQVIRMFSVGDKSMRIHESETS